MNAYGCKLSRYDDGIVSETLIDAGSLHLLFVFL